MNSEFFEKLNNVASFVSADEPMAKHTTFHTGGPCDYFVSLSSVSEIVEVTKLCKAYDVPFLVIGRGSNVLVKDEGYRGLILEIGAGMSDIRFENGTIYAEAGASLAALANNAMENGISGYEPLSGIPGLIGGAIRMNAGAYGGEVKDVLKSVTYLQNGELVKISAEDAGLSYRHSIFCDDKTKIIVAAEFSAETKKEKSEIVAFMNELAKKRREKQPLEFPSGGSTFKRPEGYFAAKLIEDAGLKGYRVGGAMVSEKHAGFVINVAEATTDDVLSVVEHVKETVYKQTGITLETEIEII